MNTQTGARYLGRAAVGVLFLIGGALLHAVNLATGGDYADCRTVSPPPADRRRAGTTPPAVVRVRPRKEPRG